MNQTNTLRVGVIGAGVGILHLAAYSQLPRVSILGLAGLDDRVPKLAAEYQVPNTYGDYRELLANADIDAVSICVPNALHAPIALAALEAGKHVIVEKPLARTADEGRAMVAAAERAGKILMVSFDKRHRGDSQWLKRYIATGALGTIYYAKAHWMRRAGIPRLGSWFVSREQAGGGPLIDLGVHVLDLALYLMGEPTPTRVTANTYAEFGPRGQKGWDMRGQSAATRLPYEVEDLATAFIRTTSGATLLLETSWATHSGHGDDFGVTLYGTEGGAELFVKNYTHERTVRLFTDLDGAPIDTTPNISKQDGHFGVIERFISAILDGTPASPSASEGVTRAAIIDACYRSASEACEVTL